jgi:LacI family transcriptional regulator
MPRRVTLRDVADLANVAIGTASQALNGKEGVLPDTRERVIQAAKTLGYDQRFQFAEPVLEDLRTIGVIKHNSYDRPGLDPFYFPVISGIERECREYGLSMVYTTMEVDDYNRATRLSANVARGQFSGLLVVGAYLNRDMARQVSTANCPVVLVDGYSESTRFDRVLMNNVESAQRAVSYLIEKGHRHIGLIGSSANCYPSIMERREGYFRALQEHGINESYVVDSILNRDASHQATLALLNQYPHVSALFVVNDNAAMGAISAVRELKCEVPDDISVVGFDDIAFAQDMVPPLTTMHVDKMEMGKLALRQLIYRIENKEAPLVTILMDTNLVARKSVRQLPSGR